MENHSLEVTRVINAPLDRVWRAWTDPAEMQKWYAPENLTTPEAEVDLKVGGAYRIAMQGDDGAHVAVGTFSIIEAPRTLAFSWRWEGSPEGETRVMLTFEEIEGGKTKVTLRHEGFADDKAKAMHTQGWESTFNKLEKYLA
ncbi:MAG: SRPBCC domain-containing protein [Candidatus Andersenbacteria bacterium]